MPDRDDLLRDLRSRLASRIEGTFTGADGIALLDALLFNTGSEPASVSSPTPTLEASQAPVDEPDDAPQASSTPRTKRGSRGTP